MENVRFPVYLAMYLSGDRDKVCRTASLLNPLDIPAFLISTCGLNPIFPEEKNLGSPPLSSEEFLSSILLTLSLDSNSINLDQLLSFLPYMKTDDLEALLANLTLLSATDALIVIDQMILEDPSLKERTTVQKMRDHLICVANLEKLWAAHMLPQGWVEEYGTLKRNSDDIAPLLRKLISTFFDANAIQEVYHLVNEDAGEETPIPLLSALYSDTLKELIRRGAYQQVEQMVRSVVSVIATDEEMLLDDGWGATEFDDIDTDDIDENHNHLSQVEKCIKDMLIDTFSETFEDLDRSGIARILRAVISLKSAYDMNVVDNWNNSILF
jgi:hypothetical protein